MLILCGTFVHSLAQCTGGMTESAIHEILGGKVRLYQRKNSRFWQCSTFLEGKKRRASTKTDSLAQAKDFAEDWYLTLRNKRIRGELLSEKTLAQVADKFLQEYVVMTDGERNADYVRGHKARLHNHLIPFFGEKGISQVNASLVQDYRMYRLQGDPNYKQPSRSTMHHEIVTLRQVLKTAIRHGWLDALPDMSVPYRASSKVSHRGWF